MIKITDPNLILEKRLIDYKIQNDRTLSYTYDTFGFKVYNKFDVKKELNQILNFLSEADILKSIIHCDSHILHINEYIKDKNEIYGFIFKEKVDIFQVVDQKNRAVFYFSIHYINKEKLISFFFFDLKKGFLNSKFEYGYSVNFKYLYNKLSNSHDSLKNVVNNKMFHSMNSTILAQYQKTLTIDKAFNANLLKGLSVGIPIYFNNIALQPMRTRDDLKLKPLALIKSYSNQNKNYTTEYLNMNEEELIDATFGNYLKSLCINNTSELKQLYKAKRIVKHFLGHNFSNLDYEIEFVTYNENKNLYCLFKNPQNLFISFGFRIHKDMETKNLKDIPIEIIDLFNFEDNGLFVKTEYTLFDFIKNHEEILNLYQLQNY